jgi:hypothetical protein
MSHESNFYPQQHQELRENAAALKAWQSQKRTYWKKLCVKNEFQLHPTSTFFSSSISACIARRMNYCWLESSYTSEPEREKRRKMENASRKLLCSSLSRGHKCLIFDKFIVKFSYRKIVLSTADSHPLRVCEFILLVLVCAHWIELSSGVNIF